VRSQLVELALSTHHPSDLKDPSLPRGPCHEARSKNLKFGTFQFNLR